MNQFLDDVEGASKDERKEETKASEVGIALRAVAVGERRSEDTGKILTRR